MEWLTKELRELYEKAKGYQQNQAPSPDYSTGRTDGFYAGVRYVFDKIEEQSNEPLALKKLRGMVGESVWIAADGIGRYDVYQGCANHCLEQFYTAALPSSSYGTDWLAYRRRPEEGTAWQQ